MEDTSRIVELTINFFETFFGVDGFVTLNTTFTMLQSRNVVNVGLAEIVEWLI